MKKKLIAMEPKLAAQNAYTTKLKNSFTGTVWKSGCNSWYLNKDGDVSISTGRCVFVICTILKDCFLIRFMVYGLALLQVSGGTH